MVYVTLADRREGDRDSITKKIRACGSELFDLDYKLTENGEYDIEMPNVRELGLRRDIELFRDFFRERTEKDLSPEQESLMSELFSKAAEGDEL